MAFISPAADEEIVSIVSANNDGDGDGDEYHDEYHNEELCTFAATGRNEVFQAIFICHTCSSQEKNMTTMDGVSNNENADNDNNKIHACLCQSCAYICHEEKKGCDVEFIGMGCCYCDCDSAFQSCCLKDHSNRVAQQMGIVFNDKPNESSSCGAGFGGECINIDIKEEESDESNDSENEKTKSLSFPFVFGVHSIPMLTQNQNGHHDDVDNHDHTQSDNIFDCDRLICQAIELVKHTKETHWITLFDNDNADCDDKMNCNNICDLEMLALAIFQHHMSHFPFQKTATHDINVAGAEWWVQVKPTSDQTTTTTSTSTQVNEESKGINGKQLQREEGIDLHYDKDETLAETFGLGSFPTLSTVTYLTSNDANELSSSQSESTMKPSNQCPTVIFPHMYDQSEDHPIPQMILSHPKKGKHIVFDGRLLHGAPYHPALRQRQHHQESQSQQQPPQKQQPSSVRVTFLVNIWINNKPISVHPLNAEIRRQIINLGSDKNGCSYANSHYNAKMNIMDLCQNGYAQQEKEFTSSFFMKQETIQNFHVHESDIDIDNVQTIDLPFVTSSETETETNNETINEDQSKIENYIHSRDTYDELNHIEQTTEYEDLNEEEEDLVLCMYPLPKHIMMHTSSDTVHIVFDKGLSPYLKR